MINSHHVQLVNESKPTGEGVQSEAIRTAQEIDAKIEARSGAATIDDCAGSPIILESDGDVDAHISVSDSSEDMPVPKKIKDLGEEIEKKRVEARRAEKKRMNAKPWVPKLIELINLLLHPINAASTASSALSSLSGFFNPEAALKRDAHRSSHAFQLAALDHSQIELQAARARIDTLTDRVQAEALRAERAELKELSPTPSSSHLKLEESSKIQDEHQLHIVLTPTRARNGEKAYTITPKAA
ncbi:hypothetical protein C0992_007905 [Termitomyces sp. T32_za158]|nr:hypothetical protein C0992_007905 [Termitomyces sp. T32_za158]